MKNTIKILGIIALVTIIGFALVSCEEPEDNPFVGTWEGQDNLGKQELAFTETTWVLSNVLSAGGVSEYASGSYEHDGSKATMTGTLKAGGGPANGSATINGEKLDVVIGALASVEFTRK